jgi:hypothetical protein
MSALLALFHDSEHSQLLADFNNVPMFFSKFNVSVREKDDLFTLSYKLYSSDLTKPIVQECRGIIFEKGTNRLICKPFTKFFNYGDSNCAAMDKETTRYLVKYDGSFVKLFYYAGRWRWASMNCIDINDAKMNNGRTLGEYLEDVIGDPKHDAIDYTRLNRNLTYMFELVHPNNCNVIPYHEPKLIFLAASSLTRLDQEINDTEWELVGIPSWISRPEQKHFNSLQECFAAAQELPWYEEGYVAVDDYGNRIKIKSARYVQMHHFKDGRVTDHALFQVYLDGELDEVVHCLPELKPKIIQIKKCIQSTFFAIHVTFHLFLQGKDTSRRHLVELMRGTTPDFETVMTFLFHNKKVLQESWKTSEHPMDVTETMLKSIADKHPKKKIGSKHKINHPLMKAFKFVMIQQELDEWDRFNNTTHLYKLNTSEPLKGPVEEVVLKEAWKIYLEAKIGSKLPLHDFKETLSSECYQFTMNVGNDVEKMLDFHVMMILNWIRGRNVIAHHVQVNQATHSYLDVSIQFDWDKFQSRMDDYCDEYLSTLNEDVIIRFQRYCQCRHNGEVICDREWQFPEREIADKMYEYIMQIEQLENKIYDMKQTTGLVRYFREGETQPYHIQKYNCVYGREQEFVNMIDAMNAYAAKEPDCVHRIEYEIMYV